MRWAPTPCLCGLCCLWVRLVSKAQNCPQHVRNLTVWTAGYALCRGYRGTPRAPPEAAAISKTYYLGQRQAERKSVQGEQIHYPNASSLKIHVQQCIFLSAKETTATTLGCRHFYLISLNMLFPKNGKQKGSFVKVIRLEGPWNTWRDSSLKKRREYGCLSSIFITHFPMEIEINLFLSP